MNVGPVLRGLVAMAVATLMTGLSLGVTVALGSEPEDPEPRTNAAPPVEILEPEPPPPAPSEPSPLEEFDPTLLAEAPSESLPSPTLEPSALSDLPPSSLAPSGLSVLPSLGPGDSLAGYRPSLPEVEDEAHTTPATPVRRPPPRYPREARRRGTEGYVVVRLRVEPTGRVSDVVVVESEPPGIFDEVAEQTARSYRFSPARCGGEPVATTLEQRIVFRLTR